MVDVFVSYKREERDAAQAIAEVLASQGYNVWWDIELLPGTRFRDEIVEIITKSKVTVVLWSQAARSSDFVLDEAGLAIKLGSYVPVTLDGILPPFGMAEYHCLSLVKWGETKAVSELEPLLAAVRLRAGEPGHDASFTTQNRSQKAEAVFWKTISEDEEPESLDLYIEKFGAKGLFSAFAERLKRNPESRSGFTGHPDPDEVITKRPINPNRIITKNDLVTTRVEGPEGTRINDVAFTPGGEAVIVACQSSYQGTLEKWKYAIFGNEPRHYRSLHWYDTADGRLLQKHGSFENGVAAVAMSPDRTRLGVVDISGQCVVMNIAMKSISNVALFGHYTLFREKPYIVWSQDSSRCVFYNNGTVAMLRPDNSVKTISSPGKLHECPARKSWLTVQRDGLMEIDPDLNHPPREVFVLDPLGPPAAGARIAVSQSGKHVAAGQRTTKEKEVCISIYESADWTRIGRWKTQTPYTSDDGTLAWIGDLSIAAPSSNGVEIRKLPELHLTHSLDTSSNCIIAPMATPGAGCLAEWWFFDISLTRLEL